MSRVHYGIQHLRHSHHRAYIVEQRTHTEQARDALRYVFGYLGEPRLRLFDFLLNCLFNIFFNSLYGIDIGHGFLTLLFHNLFKPGVFNHLFFFFHVINLIIFSLSIRSYTM